MIDIIIIATIAILYNLFIHIFASLQYKDLQYQDKKKKITIILVIAGILAIIISKILDHMKIGKLISKGLFWGGILLIITAIIANWNTKYISENFKLIIIAIIFLILVWYGLRRDKNK